MTRAPDIAISPTADALAAEVARRTLTTLAAAQAARGGASLVITGGGILERVFGVLGDAPDRGSVDWARVSLWWGDERFVGPDSPDRNDAAAFRAGLSDLPFVASNIHRMPALDGPWGDNVDDAAAAYAQELAAAAPEDSDIPSFDLVLLGVGPDGHCASIFPGRPDLAERRSSIIAVHDSPKPPPRRVSFSFRALDAAQEVWLIAAGAEKADAVAKANSGADPAVVPSGVPRGKRQTLWLIDEAAAAQLPR